MDGEASWDTYPINPFKNDDYKTNSTPEINDSCESNSISIDNILPDDVLERIISFLPIASVFRAASVCKRWSEIVNSRRFLWAVKLPQKPWYFMFTCSESSIGYAYDPVMRKWYNLEIPCIEQSNWLISSSFGLVCVMDNDSRSNIYVCNPITKDWKKLIKPPGALYPDYSALAISVDRENHNYKVTIVKSKQIPNDYLQWELSVHVYESESNSWLTCVKEVLMGWRGGDDSVICNGVLYCLIHSTGIMGHAVLRHSLIVYDLRARSPHASLMQNLISAPCPLTCGRLINLREKVVMVGGIAKHDRPDIIKGIGIWELNKKIWCEVSRMPHKFYQGFGELDDVFASSGSDNLIYIQSYGSTALLVFDMSLKSWKWSAKCPVSKRFPLQLFSGFSFEPRLESAS